MKPVKLLPISLVIPKRVLAEFKRQSKAAFPKETLCYLIGHDAGTNKEVTEIWTPEDCSTYAKKSSMFIPETWDEEAFEYAKEAGQTVLGDLHSHPYTKEALRGFRRPPPHPSQEDLDSSPDNYIMGICTVAETRTGKLWTQFRFYGPMIHVVALYK